MAPTDTRRFCLPCSGKAPRLVELVCPSKATAAEKKAVARKKKDEKKRDLYEIAGVRVDLVIPRLVKALRPPTLAARFTAQRVREGLCLHPEIDSRRLGVTRSDPTRRERECYLRRPAERRCWREPQCWVYDPATADRACVYLGMMDLAYRTWLRCPAHVVPDVAKALKADPDIWQEGVEEWRRRQMVLDQLHRRLGYTILGHQWKPGRGGDLDVLSTIQSVNDDSVQQVMLDWWQEQPTAPVEQFRAIFFPPRESKGTSMTSS